MNIEEIVARLRQTESRSKRKLLDEAADAIEELAKTSIFKRIPCEVDHRKEYVELDGIRLVCEEGQIVGWYRPGDGLVIDANKAMNGIVDLLELEWGYEGIREDVQRIFENAETVDAVTVVRCRECKHCDPENHHCDHPMGTGAPLSRKPYDFCSYGERKEGADNVH